MFGPRQVADSPYSGVIAKFIRCFMRGEPPRIDGDGEQSRDFTFVDDAVAGTLAALFRPAVPGLVYNIGGGHRVTLQDLLAQIEIVSGHTIERRLVSPPPGDPRDTSADTTRAYRDLGYEPRTDLAQGLRRQWEWHTSR